MAQTTGATTFKGVKVEISVNGSSWTDISGFFNQIKRSGGERKAGEVFTADGDEPIITAGKKSSVKLAVTIVYTEGASDPTEVVRAAYEANSALYVRWSPKGGGSNTFEYTSSEGRVTSATYPDGDVKSADPMLLEFELVCAKVTKSVNA